MSLGRATLTVGGLTAASRVAGFVRDLLIAAALGAGPVTDAFFVSLKLANFLRRLFAEGAFGVAFVPLYARLRQGPDAAEAPRFAGEAMAVLALALVPVVLLGELFMPWLVRLLATGFAPGSLQYELSVTLGRITFPYLLFISLAALFSGVLQAGQRFAAAAFAPILLNLLLIGLLLATGAEDVTAARLLAWGVVAAGLLQLAWLTLTAARVGLAPTLRWPRLSPEVRRLLRLIGPGALGVGVVQLNLLVGSWFATHLPTGTVSYLFYADRLVQLPLGIVGVALGTALLPALSLAARNGRAAHDVLNRALELALLVGLPAAVGLVLLAHPIVSVLFERGAFGVDAALATSQVLAGLAPGLPAYVLAKVLAPGFYAHEDTATPVKVAAVALAANIVTAAMLIPTLGHTGVALALSLASWANMLGLAALLWRRGQLRPDAILLRRSSGVLAALTVMGGVLAAARDFLMAPGPARLAMVIGIAGVSYLATALAAGAIDPRALRRVGRPAGA
jgi:putative peptidoglycan lipid II flippase